MSSLVSLDQTGLNWTGLDSTGMDEIKLEWEEAKREKIVPQCEVNQRWAAKKTNIKRRKLAREMQLFSHRAAPSALMLLGAELDGGQKRRRRQWRWRQTN